MRIYLLAAGTRRPAWEREGFARYAKRMPRECALQLVEVPVARRGRDVDPAPQIAREGERMLRALPRGAIGVALDERGEPMDTRSLAARLQQWMASGRDVALFIGGPDGLAPEVLKRADASWSLSPLTLPHGLARILVAESLYRAHSVLRGHPYHRGRGR